MQLYYIISKLPPPRKEFDFVRPARRPGGFGCSTWNTCRPLSLKFANCEFWSIDRWIHHHHIHMGMWRGCTDGREEAASTDAWCTITTYPIQLGLGCHYEQHSRGRCASSSIDINRWYSVICVLDITTIINERRVEGGSHFVERRRRRRDVRTRSVAVTTISGNYLLPFDRYCRYAERSTIVTHIHIICSHTQGRLPHLIRIQATQT